MPLIFIYPSCESKLSMLPLKQNATCRWHSNCLVENIGVAALILEVGLTLFECSAAHSLFVSCPLMKMHFQRGPKTKMPP
jgi:hypothetical protein